MNNLWELFSHFESVQDMPPPRPLPVALAHCLVQAQPGTARMELLNRIYNTLDLAGGIVCKGELRRCRDHIANPQEAEIS